MPQDKLLKEIVEAVLTGKESVAASLCQEAISAGIDPVSILNSGLAPGVRQAGDKFGCGEYYLPQLIMASEAMKGGMSILLPLLTGASQREVTGTIVIGSVEGDVHDIGKSIVVALLTAAGFRVSDLGVNVSPSEFVRNVQADKPDMLGMGSYMSTTLPAMEATLNELQAAGVRDSVTVLIGGVAATQQYATHIGADGFASDGPKAVTLAQDVVEAKK